MTVRVLSFGIAKEIVGSGSVMLELEEGATAEALHSALVQNYPALGKLSSFALAVNNEYAAPQAIILQDDEVAIIPPVSGG
jgi:molybdopterin synthase sulfur carrier subunit